MSDGNPFHVPYIDDRTTTLGAALCECEQNCVAACCGMDAYIVSVDNLQRWADQTPAEELDIARRQAEEVRRMLNDAPESFYFLDTNHPRQEVMTWVESVQAALAAVRSRA